MSNNFNQKVKQVKGLVFVGIILLVMINFVGCSKGGGSSSNGSSGGDVSGAVATVKSAGKEAPASDFQYDLTKDGNGISIRKYKGKGGKVVIPAKIEGYPVVEIENWAFAGQSSSAYFEANNITEIVIPDSVKEIVDFAFFNMDNLKSANLPASIKKIGSKAFAKCGNLETLTIPASLTEIDFGFGQNFEDCGKLPLKTRQRLKELGYKHSF